VSSVSQHVNLGIGLRSP